MKTFLLAFFIISNFYLMSSSFAKSTIFKCLDELGRPIFSQQASCDKPDMINYSSKKQAKKQKELQEKKKVTAEQKLQQQCTDAKRTHASYKQAPFLTKQVQMDGKTIKIRLTTEEAQKAISDAEHEIEYWCKKLK
jgi:hypothetical protein